MIYIYDEDGSFLGKFNKQKSQQIAHNKEQRDTRWNSILKTASGKYVLVNNTMWQDEHDGYKAISKEEVIDLMEHWGYDEDAIKTHFPDYEERETY
jgi:hypothetical protein